jgi:hypothetical protein
VRDRQDENKPVLHFSQMEFEILHSFVHVSETFGGAPCKFGDIVEDLAKRFSLNGRKSRSCVAF